MKYNALSVFIFFTIGVGSANSEIGNKKISILWKKFNTYKTEIYTQDKTPTAFSYLDSIIFYSKEINDENNLAKAYMEKGILLFHSYKDVSYYLDSANFYFKKNKDIENTIQTDLYQVDLLIGKGKSNEAEQLCKNNIQIIEKHKLYDNLSSFQSRLSFILASHGDVNEAIQNEMTNLSFGQRRKNVNEITRSNLTLAKLYMFYDVNKSIAYSKNAYKSINDTNLNLKIKYQIYTLYGQLNLFCFENREKAIEEFNKALNLLNNTFYIRDILSVKYHLTSAYTADKNNKKAIEILNELLEYQKDNTTDSVGLGKVYHNIAACYTNDNKFKEALKYDLKSIQLMKNSNQNLLIKEVYESLHQITKALNDSKSSLYYLEKSDSVSKLVTNKNKLNEIKRIEYNYGLKERNSKIVLLEKEKKLAEEKNYRILLYFIIGIIIIISIGIFLFVISKINEQKRILKEENQKIKLQNKNYELEQKLLLNQMNPHFISNVLLSIETYVIENDAEKASEYLSVFSKLMRSTLDFSRKEWITLKEEIRMLNSYIKLEQVRCHFSFDYEIIIDEMLGNEDSVLITPMMIQPFVENAISHGVSNLGKKGLISIKIEKKTDKLLHIEITDNGIGRNQSLQKKGTSERKSYSLQIIEERINILKKLFEKEILFDIIDIPEIDASQTGTKIVLQIPYKFNER